MALKKSEKSNEVKTEEKVEVTGDTEKASYERLNRSVELMARQFNIGEDYTVTSFADKGSRGVKITMANQDFEVVCTIKNPDNYGIVE